MTVVTTDLRAALLGTRLRVDRALAQLDAGDHELALDLVSGACIRLHDARSLARLIYEASVNVDST